MGGSLGPVQAERGRAPGHCIHRAAAGPGRSGGGSKPKGRVRIVQSFELEAPEDREALIDAVKKLFQQSAVLNDFWSPTDRAGPPASARSETATPP